MGFKLTKKAPPQGVTGSDLRRYFPGEPIPLNESDYRAIEAAGNGDWFERVPGPSKGVSVNKPGGNARKRPMDSVVVTPAEPVEPEPADESEDEPDAESKPKPQRRTRAKKSGS